MLNHLHIENIAVIKQADIPFHKGMTVLTGETGAGKSVLIGALNAVLGQKTSRDLIRTGCEKAYVSAEFDELPAAVVKLLEDNGYECDDELIVSRELNSNGKANARINGRPATVQLLSEVGALLLNIHGQHDNQALLDEARHLGILDSMGDHAALKAEYYAAYTVLKRTKKELDALRKSSAEREQRLDILSYQLEELRDASVTEGEVEALEDEQRRIRNGEKITVGLQAAKTALEGDDSFDGAVNAVSDAARSLELVAAYLPQAEALSQQLFELSYSLQESGYSLNDLLAQLDFDPARQEQVEERLSLLHRLMRKDNCDEAGLIALTDELSAEYELLSNSDNRGSRLTAEFEEALKSARTLSAKLTELRRATAEEFCKNVAAELEFLQMPGVKLSAKFEPAPFSSTGCDKVTFLISANPGEPPKSISKIASGGELSRIMLAIKSVLSDRDEIATLIFDEVDAGVSGRAATKIGIKLSDVSSARQVICITHLAQIAAYADHHLLIEKSTDGTTTQTSVSPLDDAGRIDELSRIIGGATVTDATRRSAEELLAQCRRK